MSESEWLSCCEPDLMLEELEGKISRDRLVEFVRRCWSRITRYLPPVFTATIRWLTSSPRLPTSKATTTQCFTPQRRP